MNPKLVLEKADKLETEDGLLTRAGQRIASQYATEWLRGVRNLELERAHPELTGLFYDIRLDSVFARRQVQG